MGSVAADRGEELGHLKIISERENHYLEKFRLSPRKHWQKPDRQLTII